LRDRLLLPLLLAVQAALLLWNLPLLDPWGDELFTYFTSASEPERLLRVLRHDMHPPLYFLLGHAWGQLPLPLEPLDRLRAMSAVIALAGTVLLDRLWLRGVRWETRAFALALWVLSPCLLLYARMVRGYSLQSTLAIAAVYFVWRWLEEPGRRRFWPAAICLSLLSYTHYLPGAAMAGATALLLAAKRRWTGVAALIGFLAVAYAPWMGALARAAQAWSAGGIYSATYSLTGGLATELVVKAGYAVTSFALGETLPVVAFAGFVPAFALLAVAARKVWARERTLARLLVLTALIAFAGAARWVSYAFVPGRLVFLLPFVVLGLAYGWETRRQWTAVLLVVYAAGIVSYYRKDGFLNPGFAMPYREIAGVILEKPLADTAVFADGYNLDAGGLAYGLRYLGGVSALDQGNAAAYVERGRAAGRVWFLRNSHDVSPGRIVSRSEEAMCLGKSMTVREFVPFPAWKRALMPWFGVREPVSHFSRLSECVGP
jgi:hypothetical protein